MFLLDITVCAKTQRPERAGTVQGQKRALQGGSKLGWEVASERQDWGEKWELRAKEGF